MGERNAISHGVLRQSREQRQHGDDEETALAARNTLGDTDAYLTP